MSGIGTPAGCHFSGVKRIWSGRRPMSPFDPSRHCQKCQIIPKLYIGSAASGGEFEVIGRLPPGWVLT
jgi:hypothetical protein